MKKELKTSDPNYHKNYYQKNKEKLKISRKEKQDIWFSNNKDRVKELRIYHQELRKQKLIQKRKKQIGYDNYEWFLIPNIEREYYINKNLVVIDKYCKIITTRKNKAGYITINLNKKSYVFHRVIASVFIPNLENKPEINHKNGIRHDNRIENLEWVTKSENVRHSFDVLGRKSNFTLFFEKKNKKIDR